jgi:AICAR transformylase/IMP cyclohydrolase PurH
MSNVQVRTALLSVSDKEDLLSLAGALDGLGIEMLSTGGTFSTIRDAGHRITEVAEYTGFPEMMDGRVKTLHPKVHGGLLGRRGTDDAVMAEHGIRGIDLLVINLYPFEQAVAADPANLANAIENIDIGGPAMLRSAAKNYTSVAVVTDKADTDLRSRHLNWSLVMMRPSQITCRVTTLRQVTSPSTLIPSRSSLNARKPCGTGRIRISPRRSTLRKTNPPGR